MALKSDIHEKCKGCGETVARLVDGGIAWNPSACKCPKTLRPPPPPRVLSLHSANFIPADTTDSNTSEQLSIMPSRAEDGPWPEKGYTYPMIVAVGDDGEGYILARHAVFDNEYILEGRWTGDNNFDGEVFNDPGVWLLWVEVGQEHSGDPEEGPEIVLNVRAADLQYDLSQFDLTVRRLGVKVENL